MSDTYADLLRRFEVAMVEKNLEIGRLTSALSALAAERDEWKRAAHVYDHVPLSSVPTAPTPAEPKR